jgi:hypothetical protein
MRSELIFGATTYVSNRFLLTRLASTATRKFHKPSRRIEDTTNDVLVRFSRANPVAGASYLYDLQPVSYIVQAEPQPQRERLRKSVA